jgi:hypothetical protein
LLRASQPWPTAFSIVSLVPPANDSGAAVDGAAVGSAEAGVPVVAALAVGAAAAGAAGADTALLGGGATVRVVEPLAAVDSGLLQPNVPRTKPSPIDVKRFTTNSLFRPVWERPRTVQAACHGSRSDRTSEIARKARQSRVHRRVSLESRRGLGDTPRRAAFV